MDIEGFSGQVLQAADPGFDTARGIWNQAVDRRPLAIVKCRSAADVAAAVRHARKSGLPVAVRAGGHNFAGHALVDGGLVLDLRGLRSVRIEGSVLHAGAGLRWGDVDAATAPHGLAASGGSVSSVGLAGFTLGTGLGWLGRPYGLAADNLLSAQLVTAEGEILEVGPEDHPDLFWAIRGGCGNFGVVTRFDFRLHPMDWQPQAGLLMYPVEQAAEVIAQIIDLEVPDELSYATVLTAPPFAGRPVLLVTALHAGPPDVGEPVMARLRAIGEPVLDLIRPTPFPLFQRSTDEAAPDGLRWDVRSEWLNRPDDEAITAAVRAATEAPSPLSEVLLRPLGGAVATGPDTAFSFRHAGFLLEVIANWAAGDGSRERAWMRQTWSELSRVSAGGPDVNHLGLDEGPERLRAAYSPAAHDRLVRAKRHYDPDNLFRSTQNIRP
ncbi:FAD-binding oxidoreductase [Nonomuraea soli]|uniref:FAD/FMN-containing dehydrogenase n=1 Tax=Nonomuraea soli TaxID=1032476 RepID=A0A7W0HP03_9ACTN|nr:FAD-binding oxidoreductase [Nonomuraea soli]MBA2890111.1 FAD/FMN-containing dehydrogenase [Nonomuraea soli]